ncbi:MAG: HrpJ domain-containing protein [Chlamydiales bacterium]|nr:HrpJ domain-containing protein [Chlamydiales bacterium]
MGLAGGVSGPRENVTLEAMKAVAQDNVQELGAERETSAEAFLAANAEKANPFAAKMAQSRKPGKLRHQKVQGALAGAEKEKRLIPLKMVKDTAQQYQTRNPELKSKMLLLLREYLKPTDTAEEILKKAREFYEDPALADEALEFLMDTSEGNLNAACKEAKEQLNSKFGREVNAGRNMGAVARQAAETGIGTPTSLRDLYRDITGSPREATTLFQELSQKWAFKELAKVIKFLMHSLGADLNAGGPSIPPGLLHNLLNEARTLQAILGVYKFFQARMNLMGKLFKQKGMQMPGHLNFEMMAREFMEFVGDRYPSSDKALQTAVKLGLEKWLIAKIIALSQLRDAIREVSAGKVFKSTQHRDDCYLALLEALEDLEDEMEEMEDQLRAKEEKDAEERHEKDERDKKKQTDTVGSDEY